MFSDIEFIFPINHEIEFCAGSTDPDDPRESCIGDTGGPLICIVEVSVYNFHLKIICFKKKDHTIDLMEGRIAESTEIFIIIFVK